MSQENVEVVQAAYAYLDRREIDAALALSHPEIEWVDDPRVPGGRTRRGHTEVKRYFESLPRYWESYRMVPERFIDRGDEVVVLGRMSIRTHRGGPEIERPLDQIVTLRDGKIVRARTFSSREDALEAAGLEE